MPANGKFSPAIDERVIAVAVLPIIILAVVAMLRDQVALNTGGSVPIGFYIAVDPAKADVAFCLSPLPHGTRFDPALCSPANPNGRPVIKRVARVMDGAVHVRGDIPFALDSELFGTLDITLVRGWRRPIVIWQHGGDGLSHNLG